MNAILWYQDSFEKQRGMMIIDGEKKMYDNSPLHNAAFDKLLSSRKWQKCQSVDSSLLIYFNSSTKEIFVQSHFIDRDALGRKLAFMFYLKEFHSADEVCEELANNALIAEKIVCETDMDTIKKEVGSLKHKKNTFFYVIIGIISLIIILIFIICQN